MGLNASWTIQMGQHHSFYLIKQHMGMWPFQDSKLYRHIYINIFVILRNIFLTCVTCDKSKSCCLFIFAQLFGFSLDVICFWNMNFSIIWNKNWWLQGKTQFSKYPQIWWSPNSQFSVFCMRPSGQKLWNLGVTRAYWSKFGSMPLVGGTKTTNFFPVDGQYSVNWYHTFQLWWSQIWWFATDIVTPNPQNLVGLVWNLHID